MNRGRKALLCPLFPPGCFPCQCMFVIFAIIFCMLSSSLAHGSSPLSYLSLNTSTRYVSSHIHAPSITHCELTQALISSTSYAHASISTIICKSTSLTNLSISPISISIVSDNPFNNHSKNPCKHLITNLPVLIASSAPSKTFINPSNNQSHSFFETPCNQHPSQQQLSLIYSPIINPPQCYGHVLFSYIHHHSLTHIDSPIYLSSNPPAARQPPCHSCPQVGVLHTWNGYRPSPASTINVTQSAPLHQRSHH